MFHPHLLGPSKIYTDSNTSTVILVYSKCYLHCDTEIIQINHVAAEIYSIHCGYAIFEQGAKKEAMGLKG